MEANFNLKNRKEVNDFECCSIKIRIGSTKKVAISSYRSLIHFTFYLLKSIYDNQVANLCTARPEFQDD